MEDITYSPPTGRFWDSRRKTENPDETNRFQFFFTSQRLLVFIKCHRLPHLDIYSFSFTLYFLPSIATCKYVVCYIYNRLCDYRSADFLSLRASLISILEMLWQTAILQGRSAPRSGFILSICSSVSFLAHMQQYSHQSLLPPLQKNSKLMANRARLPHSQHTLRV